MPHAVEELSLSTTTEPSLYTACEPRRLSPRAEAPAPTACDLQQEKPPQWEARALQPRGAPANHN